VRAVTDRVRPACWLRAHRVVRSPRSHTAAASPSTPADHRRDPKGMIRISTAVCSPARPLTMASTFSGRPLPPLPPLPPPQRLQPNSLLLPPASPSLPPASPPPPIDAEPDESNNGVRPPSYSPHLSLPITSPSGASVRATSVQQRTHRGSAPEASASAFIEHEYHLMNRKHVPWMSLKVRCAPCLAHQIDTLTWTCAARVRASPNIARTSLRATASGARSSSTSTSPTTSAPSRSRSALHSPHTHPSHICADHRHALLGHR
jgi:hypothetical protein